MDMQAVFAGIIAGAWYGLMMYRIAGKGEPFDGPKLLRALFIGAAVGVFAQWQGLPMPEADAGLHELVSNLGILAVLSASVDQFCIAVWKRIKPHLEERFPIGEG